MFLLAPKNVREHLVHVVAASPGAEISEILRQVRARIGKVSRQAVHKELRRLLAEQVLTKARRTYALSLPWLWESQERLNSLVEAQMKSEAVAVFLPERRKSRSWRFTSLLRLKIYWSQLVLVCLANSRQKVLFSWNPHAWFYLLLEQHEEQLLRSIRRLNARMFKMVGSSSPLDKIQERFWRGKEFRHAFAPGPFRGEKQRYFSVIDDYIISFAIPAATRNELDLFYAKHKTLSPQSNSELIAVLSRKRPVRLTITHDPLEAAKIKLKFNEYFD